MMEDEYSEFTEWAKKKLVKNVALEKREFESVYAQIIKDDSLSDEQVSGYDDREYFYEVLHTRYLQSSISQED